MLEARIFDTAHRRAVERRRVREVLLAAEVLVIGVLDPTGTEHFVRQIVRVLQDGEAGHQPGRRLGGAKLRLDGGWPGASV